MIEATCERCGRASSPGEPDDIDWETLDGDRMVCSDCITPEEEQRIDEDMMQLTDTTPLGDTSDPRGDNV